MTDSHSPPPPPDQTESHTTHFGYQQVPLQEKAHKVAGVFHSVASRYDTMNDLMSGGIHRLWKRFAIEISGVRDGHCVLDIAGGTGDLAFKFSRLVGENGQVVLADINSSMLNVGRDRLIDRGVVGNVQFAQANAAVPRQYVRLHHHRFWSAQRDRKRKSADIDVARFKAGRAFACAGIFQAGEPVIGKNL
jgi:SAM-dependent methyltransferase